MATQKATRYLELQMEELKESYETDEIQKKPSDSQKDKNFRAKNAKIAELYDDAAEYEEDLKCFETELEIVNTNKLQDIATSLIKMFPNEDRDYKQELKTIVEGGWKNLVDVEKTHPAEQLEIINSTEFGAIVERLNSQYPSYDGDFEMDIRKLLTQRWEMLISIKKAHIKEELAGIKILGLKPNYVERIYKQYHGLE